VEWSSLKKTALVPRHAGRHANSMCGSLRSPIPADDEERLTDKIDRELCSKKFQNSDKNGIVDDGTPSERDGSEGYDFLSSGQ
jgi:hypothetical protein